MYLLGHRIPSLLHMGLEASDKNFIWVIRPPIGFELNTEFKAKEWLPKGFEKRIKESRRGLLVYNWAPKFEILSHKSVSAFLTVWMEFCARSA